MDKGRKQFFSEKYEQRTTKRVASLSKYKVRKLSKLYEQLLANFESNKNYAFIDKCIPIHALSLLITGRKQKKIRRRTTKDEA